MDKLPENLISEIAVWGPKLIAAIVVFIIFWVIAIVAAKAIIRITRRIDLDTHVSLLLARSGKIALMLFGLVTALGTLGVNVSALVAGLGLTGFAVGFALKDTISNLLSGVLLLIYRPFSVSDHISVSGYEGRVVSIDLRYTILETGNDKVLIPNAKLFTECIALSGKTDEQD